MKALAPMLLFAAACAQNPAPSATGAPAGSVIPGIEVFLSDVPQRLRGKRVGLITNQSAVDRARVPDIDLIAQHHDLKLTALLAPEQGIRGTAPAGQQIKDEKDEKTGEPDYSHYETEDRGPTAEMLKDEPSPTYSF
jgi:uncharacterized protein YbbC (DUF1343 family)